MFEDDNKVIFGDTYGVEPKIHLIGGSTGKSKKLSTRAQVSLPMFSYRLKKPMSTVNLVTSKSDQSQNKIKIPNFIL